MSKKGIIKIVVDVVMTVLFVVLMLPQQTGLVFHEIVGLSILLVVLLHLLLNGKWITSMTRKLFANQINKKDLYRYFLNAVFLLGIVVVTVTGLMISAVVLPVGTYNHGIEAVHRIAAYGTGVLMLVHLGLHLKYLRAMFRKIVLDIGTSPVCRVLSGTMALVVVVGILYFNVISAVNNSQTAAASSTIELPIGSSTAAADGGTAKSKEKETEDTTADTQATQAEVTLTQFLEKITCTACHKGCLLSNPQCGKSSRQIAEAKTEYESLYSVAAE